MGRKPKIQSAGGLRRMIDAYFASCEGTMLEEDGRPVLDKGGRPVMIGARPPTVTGLARALGLSGRQSLLNYEGRREYTELIRDAKARVEQYAEERLYDRDGARGAEFTLRYNFRWGEAAADAGGGVIVLGDVDEGEGDA